MILSFCNGFMYFPLSLLKIYMNDRLIHQAVNWKISYFPFLQISILYHLLLSSYFEQLTFSSFSINLFGSLLKVS